MRRIHVSAILGVFLAAAALLAAPPASGTPVKATPIVFQDVVPPPAPSPTPRPEPPSPAAISSLGPGFLYVAVLTDQPFLIFASPQNLVRVTRLQGPALAFGKFSDGGGHYEAREIKAKYAAIVEPIGIGRVELIVVPVGADSESAASRKLLDVDDGTKPQPPPAPLPPPQPMPPKPGAGAFIVVVADDAHMTAGAAKLYDGPTLRKWKAAGKCRVYGDVLDSAKLAALGYDRMMKAEAVAAPCVLVVDKAGNTVSAFALPGSENDLAAKLKAVMAP